AERHALEGQPGRRLDPRRVERDVGVEALQLADRHVQIGDEAPLAASVARRVSRALVGIAAIEAAQVGEIEVLRAELGADIGHRAALIEQDVTAEEAIADMAADAIEAPLRAVALELAGEAIDRQ